MSTFFLWFFVALGFVIYIINLLKRGRSRRVGRRDIFDSQEDQFMLRKDKSKDLSQYDYLKNIKGFKPPSDLEQ